MGFIPGDSGSSDISVPFVLKISGSATAASIPMTWSQDQDAIPTTYQIWRSINNGVFSQINTVGGTVTTFTDTSLAMLGNEYREYKVRASRGGNLSAFTNAAGVSNTLTIGATKSWPNLQVGIGGITASGTAFLNMSFPVLHTVTGNFALTNNVNCSTIDLSSLRSMTGDIAASGSAWTTFNLPSAINLSSSVVDLHGCTSLVSASFPVLQQVKQIDFDNDTAFTSVNLIALQSTTLAITFPGCTLLTSVNLPVLVTVGGELHLENSGIASFNAPMLATIGTLFVFSSCNLSVLNLPALTVIGSSVTGSTCSLLTSILMPRLTSISGNWTTNSNPLLTTVDVSSLTGNTNGTFSLNNNPLLSVLRAQSIQNCSQLGMQNCVSLVRLDLLQYGNTAPGLAAGMDLSGCTALTVFNAPLLKYSDNLGVTITFLGDRLDATSVNAILANIRASPLVNLFIVHLEGGQNSPPTGQGKLDKAFLNANNNTITTN